jgi:ribosome-associated protein
MIRITPSVSVSEEELVEKAVRASGPGGQHVNKTSSAIELRFDVRGSTLPDDVKERLEGLAGSRLTSEGVIVLFAQEHRSQEMNREAARERLFDLIRQAAQRPKKRRPTRPTLASKVRRLEGKAKRSGIKSGRGRVSHDD